MSFVTNLDVDDDPDWNQKSDYVLMLNYRYEFMTEEDLVQSAVFQKHLTLALAHKDTIIRDLQNELLNKI